ncbi:ORF6N domain-containing protein [Chitinophaga sp. ARDCPP14]|uniref:ORF6N domain-containing protein n=1 Tax=Chitinophaga sp. ARDCPP14 TaxID=3391139 RepID=UPI003F523FB0
MKAFKSQDLKAFSNLIYELYGVETKRLKEAVRRNISRFPEDFMFEMNKEEFENWRTQFASSKEVFKGLR